MSLLTTYIQKNTKRTILTIAFFSFVLIGGALVSYHLFNKSAEATVSGSDWQAGRIIDDSIFYNNNDMSVQDIQNFLNQKVTSCDTNGTQIATDKNSTLTHAQYAAAHGWAAPPYICLKDYYQVPRSDTVVNNFGTNTVPTGAVSAASIIKTAADTYGISARVLIVTLQKESDNLLNDSWPVSTQYTNAMGYGCPDTAACDPQYAGFYNQVMNAARQFNLYRNNPSAYRYKPLQNNTISYQANNTSCGSSTVYIQTYATAGLYNYTPYQPNQAALNNMYGLGDSCSAYGNRNFWRTFKDFFGDTTGYVTVEATNNTFNVRSAANTYNSSVLGTVQRTNVTSAVCYQQGSDYYTNGTQGNTWIKIATPMSGWVPTDSTMAQLIITTGNLPACTYSVKPVYRAYNPYSEEHFWTTDSGELSFVLNNLRFGEGAPTFFAVNDSANYSGKPVFRLYNKSSDIHFWTTDPAERDFIVSHLGYVNEGYAFSVPYSDAGSKPLWRLYNAKTGAHFWTADPSELSFVVNQLHFVNEGQAFRVPQ